jgi:hypothetical protein
MVNSILVNSHTKLFVFLSVLVGVALGIDNQQANRQSEDEMGNKPSAVQKQPPIVSKIFDLVLYNDPTVPGHNQLAILLRRKKGHKKLVFQFYLEANDTLQMAAYVGRKKRRGYRDTAQILHVWPPKNFVLDLAGEKTFLNDQELSMEKENHSKNIKTLRSWINDSTKKYIVFRPRFDKTHHLYFDLIPVGKIDAIGDIFPKDSPTEFISTNPSPPKDAHY